MKRYLCIPILIALCACTGGGHSMTMTSFYDIPIGTSTFELTETAGEPYATHKKDDGSIEYEYIERIEVGGRNLETRHYFLLVKDGKVVSKRVTQSSPRPYVFDSYDMQTTHNE